MSRFSSRNQSRRSKRGSEGETHVKHLHEACLRAGVACMHRIPTEMRVIGVGAGGALLCRPAEKATVDFMGHLLDGSARVVAVEVKRIGTGERISLRSLVRLHQWQELDRVTESGGVAVLLVVGTLQSYAVPWSDAKAQKTWSEPELVRWRIPVDEPAYLRRWVSAPTRDGTRL